MLPEQLRLLMAAYADGDLSPDRRQAARRLLNHSQEARELLRQIESDACALRAMPQSKLPADFAERVLSRLPDNDLVMRPAIFRPKRWPMFASAFVAMTAVFAVCAGVWYMIAPVGNGAVDPLRVRNEPRALDLPAATPPSATVVSHLPSQPPEPTPSAIPAVVSRAPKPVTTAEGEPSTAGAALASPPVSLPEPAEVVIPRLPEFFAIQALDQKLVKVALAEELGRAESHRMDVFCRDGYRAMERLQLALKERGVHVAIEPAVAELQKRRVRGWYALYCEDLTVAEWSAVLQSAGTTDRKAEERKAGDGVFEQLVVMPLTGQDQKELTALLGFDPLASPSRPKSLDSRRPISEDTADQVAKAIGKSESARSGKRAIVLPHTPIHISPLQSNEIKQFAETSHDRRPGTIAAYLVFRTQN